MESTTKKNVYTVRPGTYMFTDDVRCDTCHKLDKPCDECLERCVVCKGDKRPCPQCVVRYQNKVYDHMFVPTF